MTKFQELYNFIDRARRSRKYADATALSLRAALKMYEGVLNEDERESLDKFKNNFEQITRSMVGKNASKSTAGSLATYKSRALKVINDYEKYGEDPLKMNSWEPKVIIRTKNVNSSAFKDKLQKIGNTEQEENATEKNQEKMRRIEFALRPDAKCILVIPSDVTPSEVIFVKGMIDLFIKGVTDEK